MPPEVVSDQYDQTLHIFRHQLHQHPELSGQEALTAQTVEAFLAPTKPSRIFRELGGHGIAFLYDSCQPGPRIGFRCELDALPIHEINSFEHRSQIDGISHKCGHDGHMSIVAGIGYWLKDNPLLSGQVLLLFQAAEETGQGAAAICQDPQWEQLRPDWLFGLHNIPGYQAGEILWKDGAFCAASKGLFLKLMGVTSHAAEPEKGLNPSAALAKIMLDMEAIPQQQLPWKESVLLTPVYAQLGEQAFGTSAGYAEYGATLRAFQEADIKLLTEQAEAIVARHCAEFQLPYELSYREVFPPTVNQTEAVSHVQQAASAAGLPLRELKVPFRWSEDFGWYGSGCRTAFFGLGAGEQQAPLHHPDYDFPDILIRPGLTIFVSIIRQVLGT